ncbi:MAG: hypothetical protein MZV70_33815 [Desulfobacterales bacterium]|nr:hypothetical protein [Desulfobacterales bacterium]
MSSAAGGARRAARGVRGARRPRRLRRLRRPRRSRSSPATSCARWRRRGVAGLRHRAVRRGLGRAGRDGTRAAARAGSSPGSRTPTLIASCAASRSARSMRASTPRCVRAAVATAARAVGRATLRLVVDEGDTSHAGARGPDSARDGGPGHSARDPAYLVITLLEQGRADYECRSVAAHRRRQGGGAQRQRARDRARRCVRSSRAPNPGSSAPRDMARFGAGLARLLLPDYGARRPRGDAAAGRWSWCTTREASRVPWETLRVGDAHPALEGGLSRRYASETPDGGALERAARAGRRRCGC